MTCSDCKKNQELSEKYRDLIEYADKKGIHNLRFVIDNFRKYREDAEKWREHLKNQEKTDDFVGVPKKHYDNLRAEAEKFRQTNEFYKKHGANFEYLDRLSHLIKIEERLKKLIDFLLPKTSGDIFRITQGDSPSVLVAEILDGWVLQGREEYNPLRKEK